MRFWATILPVEELLCQIKMYSGRLSRYMTPPSSPVAHAVPPPPAPPAGPTPNPLKRPLDPTWSLNLMGGFSVSAMPAMCTRLWGWQSMAGVSSLTEQLMREACPAASQHLSLWRAFGRWRQANFGTEPPPGQLCALFGGYLLSAGLKASTCVGYTLTVAKFVRLEVPHHPSPEWNAMHHLVRGLELRAAAEVPNHAPDISEERAEFILESITALDVQFSLWMLLTIGARAADLNRLEECQIGIANARVAVDFRITKVVRTQKERYSVSLPIWIPFKEVWRPFLSQSKPLTADCDRINRILHKAGFPETSYSFRRLFVNRIIDRFTEDGLVNWVKVIEVTGHQQAMTVRGSYMVAQAPKVHKGGMV